MSAKIENVSVRSSLVRIGCCSQANGLKGLEVYGEKATAIWTVRVGLIFVWIALTVGRPAAGLTREVPPNLTGTENALVEDTRYAAYGFLFEQHPEHERYGQFAEGEIRVLGAVIEAFADQVGGAAKLHALVDGPVRVRRDLQEVVSYTQAGRIIGLGRGAFDLAVTTEHNYYTWGAENGDELAQIVFGHEIGHRWLETLRRNSDTD